MTLIEAVLTILGENRPSRLALPGDIIIKYKRGEKVFSVSLYY